MTSHYLIDTIILLMTAVVIVPIFQVIRLGAVPGFLIAGVIVGPTGLGLISNVSNISNLAEIGVVFLLFVIGIELKPSRLWLMRRLVFGLGSLQVVFTGVLLSAISHYYFDISPQTSILIGPALALSSTAFVLQLLTEQKSLNSTYGRTSFSILLLQDLAVVPLLALVPLLAISDMSISEDISFALLESVLILGLIVVLGRYLLHPILHRVAVHGNSEIFTASAVLIVLGTALITEHIGLSMAMGAFLAGLLISDSSYRHQVVAEIQPFRGLLLGLFFISMGMSLNLNLLLEKPLTSFGLATLLIATKVAMLFPLTYLFKIKAKTGVAVALILAQSGEFALVLFSLAYQSNLLTEELFQQLLLIVLLSMLLTPLLAFFAKRLANVQELKKEANHDMPDNAPIVLAGFGRMGFRIGKILAKAGIPYIALDSDALIIKRHSDTDQPVFFGDVCKPELLKTAGAGNAKIIIVTLNDPEATLQLVTSLRKIYPKVKIYVRGHSLTQCQELRKLGVAGVVSENIEASLELARMALRKVKFDKDKRESILDDFRSVYLAQIDDAINSDDTKK